MRILALVVILFAALAAPCFAGELSDHGSESMYFNDAASGLYWFDPVTFLDWERVSVDNFATLSATWSWATAAQITALDGATAPAGLTIEDAMGLRQDTVGSGGPRWVGFYADTEPDGWLVQAATDPFDTITSVDTQAATASQTHGAWLVSTVDPVTQPRLDHLGGDLPYFHDQGTGKYWQDPGNFVGMTRTEVEEWLATNPEWRWATRADIEALVGKRMVGDVPLTDVLGPSQMTAGHGQGRWIGYYAQETAPNGMLVQNGALSPLPFLTSAGTQAGVENWDPGAWIISDANPTPVSNRSLGDVKAMFD